jgi:putative membrane protein
MLSGAAWAATSGSVSNADKQFMIAAARAHMTEAHEAQVSENQAVGADVKTLAKAIDADHTKAYVELSELASKLGVSIPKGIDISKNASFERMVHLKGERFDHEFVTDEVAAHRQALAMFKREAEHGKNADVRDYASRMIPVVEGHLKQAEACAKPVKHS